MPCGPPPADLEALVSAAGRAACPLSPDGRGRPAATVPAAVSYTHLVKGHLECKGLIVGGGRVHAIPELDSCRDGVELSHEAAVGKIAQEEIEYLMARGLDEDEATSTIVRGFLNVDIMGLPAPLKKAMDEQINKLNAGGAM